jgi:hypothetical protein
MVYPMTALKSVANKQNGEVAWQRVLLNEQLRFSPHNYSAWFKQLKCCPKEHLPHIITVECASRKAMRIKVYL